MTPVAPAWNRQARLWLAASPLLSGGAPLTGCSDDGCQAAVQVGSIDVCAELAITAAERLAGLRGHAALGRGEGLLIRFPVEGEVCLVNDGVSFAIDAVMFDASHRVSHVVTLLANDPTPFCRTPVKDVLEVAAGLATNLTVGSLGALP